MKGTYNIPNYLVALAKQKDKEQTNEKKQSGKKDKGKKQMTKQANK